MRALASRTLWRLTKAAGLNALARRSFHGQALVLGYHSVVARRPADPYAGRNTVTVEEFDDQLTVLRRFFRPISPSDWLSALAHGAALPANAAMVTFDDGYRNNLTHAAPLLERHGVPALINVTTGYIGTNLALWTDEIVERILRCAARTLPLPDDSAPTPNPSHWPARLHLAHRIRERCKEIPDQRRREYIDQLREISPGPVADDSERLALLTWEEVRTLARRGFDIGSHTVDHPILSKVSSSELSRQLSASRAAIERETGRACVCIAYPNGQAGDVPADIEPAARRAGYRLGFTVTNRFHPLGASCFAIGRIAVPGHLPTEVFQARISGIHQYLQRVARGAPWRSSATPERQRR